MLYIRPQNLLNLQLEIYILWLTYLLLSYCPPALVPDSHHFILYFCELGSDSTYKWISYCIWLSLSSLFHLAYYSQFRIVPFLLMFEWYSIAYAHTISASPFIRWSPLRLFWHLDVMNNAVMNLGVLIYIRDPDFISFRYKLKCGIVGSYVVLFLIFWGISMLFPLCLPKLHSHLQCTRIPYFPHLHQYLYLVFLMIVILTGMKW